MQTNATLNEGNKWTTIKCRTQKRSLNQEFNKDRYKQYYNIKVLDLKKIQTYVYINHETDTQNET